MERHARRLLEAREEKTVLLVVLTSDRGLCGGLNNNLFRMLVNDIDGWREKGVETDFCVIGNKASIFFKRFGGNMLAQATHLGDAPSIDDLIGTIKVMLDAFEEGKVDHVDAIGREPRVQIDRTPERILRIGERDSWDLLLLPCEV